MFQLSELKRGFKLDRHHWYQVLVLLVMFHSSTLEAGRNLAIFTRMSYAQIYTYIIATNGLQPRGTQCACAGDRLIYNCSIMGGTATLWRGTAFDCPMDENEITFRHSQFAANQEIRICNDGDLVGRNVGVVNDCYTSQLNVIVRESFNNKTVQCAFTSSEGMTTIGESLLRVVSGTIES
jgi:hypothetical protein